jgi:hypothetical protein
MAMKHITGKRVSPHAAEAGISRIVFDEKLRLVGTDHLAGTDRLTGTDRLFIRGVFTKVRMNPLQPGMNRPLYKSSIDARSGLALRSMHAPPRKSFLSAPKGL